MSLNEIQIEQPQDLMVISLLKLPLEVEGEEPLMQVGEQLHYHEYYPTNSM